MPLAETLNETTDLLTDTYPVANLLSGLNQEELPTKDGSGDSANMKVTDVIRIDASGSPPEPREDQQPDGESESGGRVIPFPATASQKGPADTLGSTRSRLGRSRRVAAVVALGASLGSIAACGSSLTPSETRQETLIIRTVAQNIAAQAIRLSDGRKAVFTVSQLGPRVAELTASSPAYTIGPNGNYPLDGDPYDETVENPTRQETRILNEIVTGFQGDVTVDVLEATPGVLEPSDAAGVLSVDIETQDEGQDFPDNQVTTTDISIDSSRKYLPGLGGYLSDWQILYSREPANSNNAIYAATDLNNTAGYGYWTGPHLILGAIGTTKLLRLKATELFRQLLPHLDTSRQTDEILGAHRLFGP